MKRLTYLLIALMIASCTTETKEFLTADARANVGKTQDIVLGATVTGTVAEELASMVIVESAAKPKILKWTVDPETTYHVVIQNEAGQWLVQTHVNGSFGFYIAGYVTNREPNDGNIHIVKGQQYYLYFSKYNIKVPFVIQGKQ